MPPLICVNLDPFEDDDPSGWLATLTDHPHDADDCEVCISWRDFGRGILFLEQWVSASYLGRKYPRRRRAAAEHRAGIQRSRRSQTSYPGS